MAGMGTGLRRCGELRLEVIMTAGEQGYRTGLVDMAAGRISREIFVNEEIYREELERLFARTWLFVGHESQIPKPGDFFVSGMGEESVILCRDRVGKVHVFLNSCRHRGMKVCRYDEGSTPVFTCPYHGWSYGTDGKLVGVPYFREAYHEKLDKSSGAWSKSRNCASTRALCGRVGTRRPRLFSNISATSCAISTSLSTAGTAAKAAPKYWAASRNG